MTDEYGMHQEDNTHINQQDISIIRPAVLADDIQFRGRQLASVQKNAVRKALRVFHCLEIMATNIYRFQITKTPKEENRQLIIAMNNEMTHVQDFNLKLYEYGFTPSSLRWVHWLAGLFLGTVSGLLGPKSLYRVDIWVERKAIRHYSHLIEQVDWDADTLRMIEKNQADELGHVGRWEKQLMVITGK